MEKNIVLALVCLLCLPFLASKPKKLNKDIIKLETSLDNNFYFANKKEVYLLVNLQAGKIENKVQRPALNLSLVLDKSGSMEGDKLKYAKKACKFLVENLEKDDIVSLVTYDDVVKTLSSSKKIDNKSVLKEKIEFIKSGGSTNLSGGMLEGYSQVKSTYDKKRVNRVLLLSDGLANRGITDRNELQKIAQQKNREEGITLSTFGVGADFNEILMTNLAEYGSGNYYFIESADKIPEIFAQELKGLLSVVAQNSKVSIEFPNQNLQVNKVYGFPYKVNQNKIEIDFKDIFSEELKSVLIKFDVTQPITSNVKFKTSLSYDDAQTYKRVELRTENILKANKKLETFQKGFNQEVLQLIALYEANESLEKAMLEVDRGEFDKAKKTLKTAKAKMNDKIKVLPKSQELDKQMNVLKSYENDIEDFKNRSYEEQKMIQKSNRNSNYKLRKRKK